MKKPNYKFTSIRNVPIVGNIVRSFDKDVGKNGLKRAALGLINKAGVKCEIRGVSEELRKIFADDSVLIVCNHPYSTELFPLLGALPDRKDLYIIIAAELLQVGPNFSQHLIPVYMKKKAWEESKILLVKLGRNFYPHPCLTPEEEHRKNIQAIGDAIQKLQQGGIVLMFPSGLTGRDDKWLSGIGWLLHGLAEEKSKSYLVKAFVGGTSNLDILRFIPGVGKLFPNFKVTFSDPKKVSGVIENSESDPKKLTKKLQDEYYFWSKSNKNK